jgi:hypothetical protein
MTVVDDDPLGFYSQPGFMTDPQGLAVMFAELPDDLPALCKVVQGLLLHQYWAQAYDYSIPTERESEYQIRDVAGKLARIGELDARPLTEPRPPERRLIGNCRDFAVLLTAMLRFMGFPARARCGFATYFCPGWHEDHLICEVWSADDRRWVLVDAQLDEVQQKALKISFDPCDIPRDQFLPGGMAWQMCQQGKADPDSFGYGDTVGGLPNVRGNLVRDIAFLNKVEILGWDYWGLVDGEDSSLTPDDLALLDQAAALSLAGNEDLGKLRALYLRDMRMRVPPIVRRYDGGSFAFEDILEGNPSLAKYL